MGTFAIIMLCFFGLVIIGVIIAIARNVFTAEDSVDPRQKTDLSGRREFHQQTLRKALRGKYLCLVNGLDSVEEVFIDGEFVDYFDLSDAVVDIIEDCESVYADSTMFYDGYPVPQEPHIYTEPVYVNNDSMNMVSAVAAGVAYQQAVEQDRENRYSPALDQQNSILDQQSQPSASTSAIDLQNAILDQADEAPVHHSYEPTTQPTYDPPAETHSYEAPTTQPSTDYSDNSGSNSFGSSDSGGGGSSYDSGPSDSGSGFDSGSSSGGDSGGGGGDF